MYGVVQTGLPEEAVCKMIFDVCAVMLNTNVRMRMSVSVYVCELLLISISVSDDFRKGILSRVHTPHFTVQNTLHGIAFVLNDWV